MRSFHAVVETESETEVVEEAEKFAESFCGYISVEIVSSLMHAEQREVQKTIYEDEAGTLLYKELDHLPYEESAMGVPREPLFADRLPEVVAFSMTISFSFSPLTDHRPAAIFHPLRFLSSYPALEQSASPPKPLIVISSPPSSFRPDLRPRCGVLICLQSSAATHPALQPRPPPTAPPPRTLSPEH